MTLLLILLIATLIILFDIPVIKLRKYYCEEVRDTFDPATTLRTQLAVLHPYTEKVNVACIHDVTFLNKK